MPLIGILQHFVAEAGGDHAAVVGRVKVDVAVAPAHVVGVEDTLIEIGVNEHGHSDLPHIARALGGHGLLACAIEGREENGDQGGNDADHDQEFDKGKSSAR